jgi:hypothetical protein
VHGDRGQPRGSANGGTLLRQNWDWVGSQRESLILLRVREAATAGLPDAHRGRDAGEDRLEASGLRRLPEILRSIFDGERAWTYPCTCCCARCSSAQHSRRDRTLLPQLSFGSSSNVLCGDRGGDTAA